MALAPESTGAQALAVVGNPLARRGQFSIQRRRTAHPPFDYIQIDQTGLQPRQQPAHVSMAGVHRVAALIKRWMLGTHHGSVQPEHLDAYLDEFVFRFNRRTSNSRGLLFYRLLQQAMQTEPFTYADVVKKAPRKSSGR